MLSKWNNWKGFCFFCVNQRILLNCNATPNFFRNVQPNNDNNLNKNFFCDKRICVCRNKTAKKNLQSSDRLGCTQVNKKNNLETWDSNVRKQVLVTGFTWTRFCHSFILVISGFVCSLEIEAVGCSCDLLGSHLFLPGELIGYRCFH